MVTERTAIKIGNNEIILVSNIEKRIEIYERDPAFSFYWFYPITVSSLDDVENDLGMKGEGELVIDEKDVEDKLRYYLEKHFDKECAFNRFRREWKDKNCFGESTDSFKSVMTYNYYTYDVLNQMLEDIDKSNSLSCLGLENIEEDDVLRLYGVNIDFYNRFSKKLRKLMFDNPNASAVIVVGL